jgi:HSP20 family protein
MSWRGFDEFWDPWREIARVERDMGRQFGWLSGVPGGAPFGSAPAVNVRADQTQVTVTAELPGVSLEDVDVSVVGRRLTLRGERRTAEPDTGGRYHRRERESGRFARAVTLPYPVEVEAVTAGLKDGVLTITLPRAAADRPRKITVQAA